MTTIIVVAGGHLWKVMDVSMALIVVMISGVYNYPQTHRV